MAGLWAFGPNNLCETDQLTDGLFAEAQAGWTVSSANPPRTDAKHLRVDCTDAGGYNIRRVFGGPKKTVGVAGRFYFPNLPAHEMDYFSGLVAVHLMGFMAADGTVNTLLVLGTDGAIVAYRGFNYEFLNGGGFTFLARSLPAITARGYQHVEARVTTDDADGAIEVRVNGVTVLNLTGVNNQESTADECSQVFIRGSSLLNNLDYFDVESWHAWDTDTSGPGPSDFVGNVACINRSLTADTAVADWAKTGGVNGYAILSDGNDATFISTDTVTDKSKFAAAAIDPEITGIVYQQVNYRSAKNEAGDANIMPRMFQGVASEDGVDQPQSGAIQWYWSIFDQDPGTSGAPWTPGGVDTSEVEFERTL